MHVILLKFAENRASAAAHMAGHNAWIAQGVSDGVFQCVGSLDVGGGFILAHGQDDAGLRQRIAADPFVEHSVVNAEVFQIDVKQAVPELSYLAVAGETSR